MSEMVKLFFMVGESTMASPRMCKVQLTSLSIYIYIKKATRRYKNQAIILLAGYSARPLGVGNTNVAEGFVGKKISAPALLPRQLVSSFRARFGDAIPVQCGLTNAHSPDPPGCSRKADNSPRFCPPSSALLCSRFSVTPLHREPRR